MKIYGIGTDIVKCDRIKSAWDEHGVTFAKRVLSNTELETLQLLKNNQGAFLAKRFAAKEAVVKALGTGFRDDVLLTHMSINADELGKPFVEFIDKTKEYVATLGKLDFQLSIADEAEYVVAFAIAIEE